jgi:predicted DNA-binding WGR domain protein
MKAAKTGKGSFSEVGRKAKKTPGKKLDALLNKASVELDKGRRQLAHAIEPKSETSEERTDRLLAQSKKKLAKSRRTYAETLDELDESIQDLKKSKAALERVKTPKKAKKGGSPTHRPRAIEIRKFDLINNEHEKFWEITRYSDRYIVCFGRIGTHGQCKKKMFKTPEETRAAYQKIIREKFDKGYRETF